MSITIPELINSDKDVIEADDLTFVKGQSRTKRSNGKYVAKRFGSLYFETEIRCQHNELHIIKKATINVRPVSHNYKIENTLTLPDYSESGDSLLDLLLSIPFDGTKRLHVIKDETMFKSVKLEAIRNAICDRLNNITDYEVRKNGMRHFWQEPAIGQIYLSI